LPGNVSRFVYFSTYRGLLARGVLVAGMACGPAADGTAQQRTTYDLYGMPGLLDMPTALSAPDGELAATLAILGVGDQARGTLSFQVTPRLTAAFRYASIDNYLVDGERRRLSTIRSIVIVMKFMLPTLAVLWRSENSLT